MDDSELLRYSRHVLLDEIGIEGQARISASRVLIIGAGGLASPAAAYLAAAGVASLTLCDKDRVDLTNLQRQILFDTASIGETKVAAAARRLTAVNPLTRIVALERRVTADDLPELVGGADIVLDCSDNFSTRHAINRACVAERKPLVSGAAIRFAGQIAVFDLRSRESPCYFCLFGDAVEADDARCATMGVFSPLVGIVGAMQAAEALKLMVGIGPTLNGRLVLFDALSANWREVRILRDPGCPVCSKLQLPAAAG